MAIIDLVYAIIKCRAPVVRQVGMNDLCNVAPPAMAASIRNMSPEVFATFILSGLGSSYVHEWYDIYMCVCKFINTLYNTKLTYMFN